jgi:hypothetical protein
MSDESIDQLQRQLKKLKEEVERLDKRVKTLEGHRKDAERAARMLPR